MCHILSPSVTLETRSRSSKSDLDLVSKVKVCDPDTDADAKEIRSEANMYSFTFSDGGVGHNIAVKIVIWPKVRNSRSKLNEKTSSEQVYVFSRP